MRLGTKLEWLVLTPLMPSLETTHPNCDAAIPGLPWNAPFRASRGDTRRTAPFQTHLTRAAKDSDTHDEAYQSNLTPRFEPPPAPEGDRRHGCLARRRQAELPRRRLRARRGSGGDQGHARVHCVERR